MPRVAHITTVHYAFDNRIFMKECASLRDNGWDVLLVAQHEQDETVDGIHIKALPRATNRMQRMRDLPPLAVDIALGENPDILHFHDPELLPLASKLARQGRHVVFDMHENIAKDILSKQWINPLLRPALSFFMRLRMREWLRHMPVIFAEDSYAADYPYVRKSTTVLNMPLLAKLSKIEAEHHERPTLVYIGGITEARGSLCMLRVLSRLQHAGYDVGLELIGPTEAGHLASLQELIARLEIRHVTMHGYLRADEAWPLVARCHIGMALLSRIPNYEHSYPSKIFEYMALGLPVLSSDFELYRSVVEANSAGICVAPDDNTAVENALRRLLDDAALREQMGFAGQQAAQRKYSWTNEERKLLAFYAELLG